MGPSFMKTSSPPNGLLFCQGSSHSRWMPSHWHHHLLLSNRLMVTPSTLRILMFVQGLTCALQRSGPRRKCLKHIVIVVGCHADYEPLDYLPLQITGDNAPLEGNWEVLNNSWLAAFGYSRVKKLWKKFWSGHTAPPPSSLSCCKQRAMGSLVLKRCYNSF